MKPIKDGGPAFPHDAGDFDNPNPGMTLRDWFAGQAIQGIMRTIDEAARAGRLRGVIPDQDTVALSAYQTADAMLAERKKENENV